MPKDFLTIESCSTASVRKLLENTLVMKKDRYGDTSLAGKTIAIIFSKSSTRTRMGFEIGMQQLGGYASFLSHRDIQLGRGETLADTAKVMSRYVDGLVVRTFAHSEIEELAREATIPVINALTDDYHPCQAIADFTTILEKKGKLEGIKLAYIGDSNNVANSLIIAGAKLGVDINIASPDGYKPDKKLVARAETINKTSGGKLMITSRPAEAADGADVIYTDVWASMGQEEESEKRKAAFSGFTVDDKLLAKGKPDCIVMHCLPAHRGEEISASVIDGPNSVVWDQAENKLHAQKAVLKMVLLGDLHG
ncbi:MAG: ornithine carbamoyltransferase [Nitrospinota bacterium]|nr:ornithine carbamoyltransferase [Nitrospinota bacterium]